MLINNWYVAATEEDVKSDAPFRVKMLGLWFALFRNADGEVVCVNDTCCHRGGSLGLGKVVEGCIQCNYHGWRFNSSGNCVRIPALGEDAKIPKRARVDQYPVVHKYGWIWVFLGDLPEHERPPIPDVFEEYYDSAARGREEWAIIHLNYEVECNWARTEENSIDGAHPSFVHSAFGSKRDPRLMLVEPVGHEWGSSTYRERVPTEVKNLSKTTQELFRGDGPREKTKALTWFSLVGICHLIDIDRGRGIRQISFAARTPIDDDNTRIFFHQVRNFKKDAEFDQDRLEGNIQAAKEDNQVSQHVNPRYLPQGMADELLVESDQNEIPFRRLIHKLIKRGWEIDSDEAARMGRYNALAIPCPARRDDPNNWIAKPIPTTYPREAQAES